MPSENFLRATPGRFVRDLCVVAAMALSAICLGFLINHFRANPLPIVYEPIPVVDQLDLAAFRDVVEHRVTGIILDARSADNYRIGHVRGAISLSRENFQADLARERKRLEAGKSQVIVVYCTDPNCDDSDTVAGSLARMAYRRVYVFKGGWEEWTAAHLPEEKAP